MSTATATKTRTKRVFIVGCRRSGTTWSMQLMAQHPRVVAAQQIDFFRRLQHFGRWFRTREQYGMCLLTSELREGLDDGEAQPNGLHKLPLSSALSTERYYDLVRPLAADVYDRFAACNPGADVVVEQTPEYVQSWEEILEVFPDAYFVHVIRDPRSVFCSHRNAAKSWADPTRFSYDPYEVAAEWVHDVSRGRAIADATDRYMELRYEPMRADSANHLQAVFEFLDLPTDPESCERAVEACSLDRMRKTSTAPKGFYRKGEAHGWRAEMSAADVRAVEHVAGPLMDELGIERVNAGDIPAPFRLRARQWRAGLKNRLRAWAWNDASPMRRFAARLLKAFPGVRKLFLSRLQKPPG